MGKRVRQMLLRDDYIRCGAECRTQTTPLAQAAAAAVAAHHAMGAPPASPGTPPLQPRSTGPCEATYCCMIIKSWLLSMCDGYLNNALISPES